MDDDRSLPMSSHPIDGCEWDPGSLPWIRGLQSATEGEPGVGYATCLFCGAASWKLSVSDFPLDHARITLYCDNSNCDARDIEVMVTRDSGPARRRADVRGLRAIDQGRSAPDTMPRPAGRLQVLDWDAKSDGAALLHNRTDETRRELHF